jgi:uncharacterized protein (TIGR04255 family)
MLRRIPVRLKREPLLEAVWELRFSGDPEAANVLPGVFYKALAGAFPKIVRLPLMDVPAAVIEAEPEFWFSPRLRLEGGNRAIQVGARVFTLNLLRPYPGWADFSRQIRVLLQLAQESGVVRKPERFSFKYVNMLEESLGACMEILNADLRLGEWNLASSSLQLRVQSRSGDFIHSCMIASPATVERPDLGKLKGTIVETEVIGELDSADPWKTAEQQLDSAHLACKEAFFGILREKTVTDLEPEYET